MSHLAPELSDRNETAHQRADRHLAELMQEVRVAQTGVQVLFGFLLTVPFSARFQALATGERRLYLATLCVAGLAAMLLIAPTAQHRVLFRCNDKDHIVRMGNRYAIAGLACVGASMVGAILLVSEALLDSTVAAVIGVVAAAAMTWAWYLQPLLRRRALFREAPRPERPVTAARVQPRAR
jgi:hypothetical protein